MGGGGQRDSGSRLDNPSLNWMPAGRHMTLGISVLHLQSRLQ